MDILCTWQGTKRFSFSRRWRCGYCGCLVASSEGYIGILGRQPPQDVTITMCTSCGAPTFFDERDRQHPGPIEGGPVDYLPPDIEALYGEIRRCTAMSAYTAAVLVARKLLMHVAVEKGAPAGASFLECVEHLDAAHWLTPQGRPWVDCIRQKGNEQNHEVRVANQQDATALLYLTEQLLRHVYEMPGRAPKL